MSTPRRHPARRFVPELEASVLAGALAGLVAALSLTFFEETLNERSILWWTPIAFGLALAPIGLLAASARRIFARRPSATGADLDRATAFTAVLVVGLLSEGRWRLHGDHPALAEALGRREADALWLCLVLLLATLCFETIRRHPRIVSWRIGAIGLFLAALGSLVPVEKSQRLTPPAAASPSGPNIILLAIDTLRDDHLKLYDPRAPTHTPSIERLARDGILFENGVAQGSWTRPSFGSIYTSLNPREHTAIDIDQRLPDEVTTLAEVLRDAGYTTLGMSNCNPNNGLKMNFGQGFEFFQDLSKGGSIAGIPISARRLEVVRRFVAPFVDGLLPFYVDVDQYYQRADRVTKTALEWIDTRTDGDRPFFLVVHFMDPHDPYMDGARTGRGYTHHLLRTHDRASMVDDLRRAYVGDIDFMDTHLGHLLDGLDERGLYEDALIVLTADHGEEFLEHGDLDHGQSVYEELIRVPLLVKLPHEAAANVVDERVARHIDIAPTLLSLANLAPPASMQGRALLADDGSPLDDRPQLAFAETNLQGRALVSVVSGTLKYIRDGSDGEPVSREELYDLAADPTETRNLLGERPEDAEALAVLVETFLDRDAGISPDEAAISSSMTDQLRALGYVD